MLKLPLPVIIFAHLILVKEATSRTLQLELVSDLIINITAKEQLKHLGEISARFYVIVSLAVIFAIKFKKLPDRLK